MLAAHLTAPVQQHLSRKPNQKFRVLRVKTVALFVQKALQAGLI